MKSLSLSLTATVITATILLGALFNLAYHHWFDNQERELKTLKSNTKSLASLIDNSENPTDIISAWNRSSNITLSIEAIDSINFPTELSPRFLAGEAIILTSPSGIYAHYLLPQNNAILEAKLDSLLPNKQRPLAQLALTLGFYCALSASVILWLLPLIKQLRQLNSMASKVGEGDFQCRTTSSRFSYIRNIEQTFNLMAHKIQQLLDDNKLLSRAVSHNLKTPLARFRFGIDMLQEEPLNHRQKKYLSHLESDLNAMEQLVTCLLDYAKLDDSAIVIQPNLIDACDIIHDVISQVSNTRNLNLTLKLGKNLMINTDKTLLIIMLQNLVENAIRFASCEVYVSAELSDKNVRIMIEDDGPGIPAHDVARLIKPFEKGEQQTGALNSENHGMGLAICEKLTHWLSIGWTIKQSPTLKGTRITLTMPYCET